MNLKVVFQDGIEVYFKLKQTTPLKKLMDAFCNHQGISTNSVRFLYGGNTIHGAQTPAMLGMEDGDVIDALVEIDGLGIQEYIQVALAEMQSSDEFAQASKSDAAEVRRLALSPHHRRPACGAG